MAKQEDIEVVEEQVLYGRVLERGMYFGLLALVVTFFLYVSGILQPVIPLDVLSSYWSQNVHNYLVAINQDFLHHENLPTGWAWLKLLNRGDFVNFIGMAILSGISILCYLAIVPCLLRKKDYAYAAMCVLEVLILALAASGMISGGGH